MCYWEQLMQTWITRSESGSLLSSKYLKRKLKMIFENFVTHRSSRPEVFCKKDVLRNFTKFTGKHLCQSLFLLKKRLWYRCFPVNFAKFLRTPFFYRTPLVVASVHRSVIFDYLFITFFMKVFFFYLDFLSQTFTIHMTAGEGGAFGFWAQDAHVL